MHARLFCKTGELKGIEFEILKDATIGSHQDNSVQLGSAYVSRHHAVIEYHPAERCYYLKDLESRNGTALDGSRVTQPQRLGRLHVITFAETHDFIFVQSTGEAPSADLPREASAPRPRPEKTILGNEELPAAIPPELAAALADENDGTEIRTSAPAPVKNAKGGKPGERLLTMNVDNIAVEAPPFLDPHGSSPAASDGPGEERTSTVVRESPSKGRRLAIVLKAGAKGAAEVHPLKDGRQFIGRAAGCDIRFEDPSLSRRHAELVLRSGRVFLKDLESRNGSFLKGNRVVGEVEWLPGTSARLGWIEVELVWRD